MGTLDDLALHRCQWVSVDAGAATFFVAVIAVSFFVVKYASDQLTKLLYRISLVDDQYIFKAPRQLGAGAQPFYIGHHDNREPGISYLNGFLADQQLITLLQYKEAMTRLAYF